MHGAKIMKTVHILIMLTMLIPFRMASLENKTPDEIIIENAPRINDSNQQIL